MKIALVSGVAGLALLVAGCGDSGGTTHMQAPRALIGARTNGARGPVFVAHVTSVTVHGPDRPGTLVTVTFTVQEEGEPPGAGLPAASAFLVLLTRANQLAPAHGSHGYYRVTTRLGPGGVAGIQVGGFIPSSGTRVQDGGFWLPTVNDEGQ